MASDAEDDEEDEEESGSEGTERVVAEVEAQVETVDRTGVEMEAMTACSVAALTIYDMCKSADRAMVIGDLTLWEKTGGRSGVYRREESPAEMIDRQAAEAGSASSLLSSHDD